MDILQLLIFIVVIAVVAWGIVHFIPMPPPFPNIVIGVCLVIVLLIVLSAFGVLGTLHQPVPKL